MATYAIGDIQGCYDELRALLAKLSFSPDRDRVWFVGDLVNRGPKSLETLRFIKGLGDAAVTVLGNHDLTLLAKAAGLRDSKPKDTLGPVFKARDRKALISWLRHRPLLHHDPKLGYTLVHAGLLPQWDLDLARRCAREVEKVLAGARYKGLLEHMYGDQPNRWSDDLRGWDRLRLITNAFTRLRYCDQQGRIYMEPKGPPGTQPKGLVPWFKVRKRRNAGLKTVFGHWSSLGLRLEDGIVALDTGCVWGGALTAVRLNRSKPVVKQLKCKGGRRPGT